MAEERTTLQVEVWQWLGKHPHLVHALLAVALALASTAGRMTVPPGGSYAFVWPAAGVAFLWLAWAWHQTRRRVVAASGVFLIITLFNGLTGLAPLNAILSGLTGLIQPLTACVVMLHLVGGFWQRSVSDYFRLGVAGLAGASAGGGFIVGASTVLGLSQVPDLAPWVLRNGVSLIAIGSLGLVLGAVLSGDRIKRSARMTLEKPILVIVTLLVYAVSFGQPQSLPISSFALPANIWAGARLSTASAMVLSIVGGGLVVSLTVAERGPFQDFGDGTTPAYIAQAFIFLAFSVSAVIALYRDERRSLIQQTREAKAQAEAAAALRDVVITKLKDGIIVVGPNGIVMQNATSKKLLGRDTPHPESELSEHYDVRRPDGSRLPEEELPVNRALAGETVERAESDVVTPDGSVRHLSIDAVPLQLHDGPGAVVVFRDVTEERQHQAQLTRFASVVAHDLASPLTAFDGWLEYLEDGAQTDTERRDAHYRLRQASIRMRTLISNLLTYSLAKEDKIHPVALNVGEVCQEIVDLRTAGPAQGYLGQVHIDADVQVVADPHLLRQLLDNLIGNAIKYSRPGAHSRVHITGQLLDGVARVVVADNGIGIPEEDLETVFDEFQRARNGAIHAPGTGLGLAICRRIVKSHGGSITVSNRSDGGCQFNFTLPTAAAN